MPPPFILPSDGPEWYAIHVYNVDKYQIFVQSKQPLFISQVHHGSKIVVTAQQAFVVIRYKTQDKKVSYHNVPWLKTFSEFSQLVLVLKGAKDTNDVMVILLLSDTNIYHISVYNFCTKVRIFFSVSLSHDCSIQEWIKK